jgi:ferric-dicitrate binding protein FerR (iron transport regulator)
MRDSTDDPLARVLRLARAESEAELSAAAERARPSVAAAWRGSVAQRRRRRGWLAAGALAVAGLAVTVVLVGSRPRAPVGRLDISRGAVTVVSSDHRRPLEPGVLRPGHVLATHEGRAVVALEAGPKLRIDTHTRLVFEGARRLRLEAGAIYFDSRHEPSAKEGDGDPKTRPQGRAVPIVVETAVATLTNLGTAYQARISGNGIEVAVRSGVVRVDRRRGPPLEVRDGELLRLSGPQVETASAEPTDPLWSWSRELGPPFVAEGRTLGDFLDWFEHETGLEARVTAGPDVRQLRLRGDVVWHDPLAALEPTLRLLGLRGEVKDGVVLVSP